MGIYQSTIWIQLINDGWMMILGVIQLYYPIFDWGLASSMNWESCSQPTNIMEWQGILNTSHKGAKDRKPQEKVRHSFLHTWRIFQWQITLPQRERERERRQFQVQIWYWGYIVLSWVVPWSTGNGSIDQLFWCKTQERPRNFGAPYFGRHLPCYWPGWSWTTTYVLSSNGIEAPATAAWRQTTDLQCAEILAGWECDMGMGQYL